MKKKIIREIDLFDFTSFLAWTFFKFSGQLCKDYELRHKNSHKSWKSLSQKLSDDDMAKNFVLILMKNLGKYFWSPLEIVVKLKEVEKFSRLIEFIIEHEDPTSRVDVQGYEKWNRYKGLTSIHLAAFYNLNEVVKKLTTKYEGIVSQKN